jgi:hypothetical protein
MSAWRHHWNHSLAKPLKGPVWPSPFLFELFELAFCHN